MPTPTYQYNQETDAVIRIFTQVNPQTGKTQALPQAQVTTREMAQQDLREKQYVMSLFPAIAQPQPLQPQA